MDELEGLQIFQGSILFYDAGSKKEVHWQLQACFGKNPFKRWAGMFMGTLMGRDMEEGLSNLKRLSEKENK